jgi:hypothetical protein
MFSDKYNTIFNMCFSIIKVHNALLYNCIMIFRDVDFPQKNEMMVKWDVQYVA